MANYKNKKKGKKSNVKNKKESKKIETVGGNDTDLWPKVFSVLGVVCFFCIFYLLTLYITNKNNGTYDSLNDTPEEVQISYDETIVGRALSMNEEEYLVLFYDISNEDISETYDSIISTYNEKDDHLKLYKVDMSKAFNKPYVTEDEANRSPETNNDFAIHGPTLIYVSNWHVAEYFDQESEIQEYLS